MTMEELYLLTLTGNFVRYSGAHVCAIDEGAFASLHYNAGGVVTVRILRTIERCRSFLCGGKVLRPLPEDRALSQFMLAVRRRLGDNSEATEDVALCYRMAVARILLGDE